LPQVGKATDMWLLIIGIVGTTVAPWQLFFQQSYVVDKRITPRFIRYERLDLWIGIGFVIVGGVAIMAFTAATFAGQTEFGNFTDAGGIAAGIDKYVGKAAGVMFAIALIDAALIGASAVSLSTAYAIGDTFSAHHSLHRKVTDAKAFYAVYFLLIAIAAAVVLTPGSPLGALTLAVQVLAGVLLPSATVFLLLLSNDKAVLGPWVNPRWLNYFTGAVIAVLVILSVVLTVSVLFPDATNEQVILGILGGGVVVALVVALAIMALSQNGGNEITAEEVAAAPMARNTWRMPPLDQLPPAKLSLAAQTWMGVLRLYLVVAGGMVLFRIVMLAIGQQG
jgi:Mn2+/Fe2+ NRAMP family transporter